jgi:hypothetical protein
VEIDKKAVNSTKTVIVGYPRLILLFAASMMEKMICSFFLGVLGVLGVWEALGILFV